MTANKVLEALKGKISDYWYGLLKEWLSIQPMHGLFRAKYKIEPIGTWQYPYGYTITNLHNDEDIIVYS